MLMVSRSSTGTCTATSMMREKTHKGNGMPDPRVIQLPDGFLTVQKLGRKKLFSSFLTASSQLRSRAV